MSFDAPVNAARDVVERLSHQQRRSVAGQLDHLNPPADVDFHCLFLIAAIRGWRLIVL
jgi:hypothetical protein